MGGVRNSVEVPVDDVGGVEEHVEVEGCGEDPKGSDLAGPVGGEEEVVLFHQDKSGDGEERGEGGEEEEREDGDKSSELQNETQSGPVVGWAC